MKQVNGSCTRWFWSSHLFKYLRFILEVLRIVWGTVYIPLCTVIQINLSFIRWKKGKLWDLGEIILENVKNKNRRKHVGCNIWSFVYILETIEHYLNLTNMILVLKKTLSWRVSAAPKMITIIYGMLILAIVNTNQQVIMDDTIVR